MDGVLASNFAVQAFRGQLAAALVSQHAARRIDGFLLGVVLA